MKSPRFSDRLPSFLANSTEENLTFVAEMFEAGTVVPVIDSCHPLDEAGEALRLVGDKRALGKVVITP